MKTKLTILMVFIIFISIAIYFNSTYYKNREILKLDFFEIAEDTNFTEIHFSKDLSYDVFEYDNMEDYKDDENKQFLTSVEYNPNNKIIIEMKDIVSNDYSGTHNGFNIFTEEFTPEHYMYLNLSETDLELKPIIEDIKYEVELTTLIDNDDVDMYFYLGIPESIKTFRLIPLYFTKDDLKNLETRLKFEDYKDNYKFFATAVNSENNRSALIVSNRTRNDIKINNN